MEALGMGANVATFVVIAAQTAKFLHNTYSAIKDGPENVRRIADQMLQLHGILEQLKKSRVVTHDTALAGQVELCLRDLVLLAEPVRELQFTASELRTGKIWKRFKLFLNEKRLGDIGAQVEKHAIQLNLRLSILTSNTIEEVSTTGRRTFQLANDFSGMVQKHTDIQIANIDSVDQTLRTLLASQHVELKSNLSSIQSAVENVSSISRTEVDVMYALLYEIKDLIVSSSSQSEAPSRKNAQSGTDDKQYDSHGARTRLEDEAKVDYNLIKSITRLGDLVKEKNRTFDTYADNDTEAEDIIRDLQVLLSSVRKYDNSIQQVHQVSSISQHIRVDNKALRSELRRFEQAFGQFSLSINGKSQKQRRPNCKIAQQRRLYTTFDVGIGTLSFITTKRTQASTETHDDSLQPNNKHLHNTMVLSFLPRNSQRFKMVVASTLQQSIYGAVSSISQLEVKRVLPAGSLVFRLVQEGRLQELQEMLQRGEASLHDHDEYGASLLMYSTAQPDICKFLLTEGADTDHVGGDRGAIGDESDAKYVSSALQIGIFHNKTEPRIATRVNQCRRLLLEAGADPTINLDNGIGSLLSEVSRHGTPESIQLVWGSGLTDHFTHINDILDGYGRTPLLHMCENYGSGFTAEMFSQLLDLGADIDYRDPDGQSCLHECVKNVNHHGFRRQVAAIHLLIEKGADPHACDDDGFSVSEAAYLRDAHISEYRYDYGSLAGDLWDSVLQACGYALAKFRRNYQRRGKYTWSYTREDFESLWLGREDQCPYWDDTPWPPEEASRFLDHHWCCEFSRSTTEDSNEGVFDENSDFVADLNESVGYVVETEEPEYEDEVPQAVIQGQEPAQDEQPLEEDGISPGESFAVATASFEQHSQAEWDFGEQLINEETVACDQSCGVTGGLDSLVLFENPWT
ncbi:ankyrin [Xylariaceae sp. AK1471]|nr:ankyrin [Xylariaceae sp. AK1471]